MILASARLLITMSCPSFKSSQRIPTHTAWHLGRSGYLGLPVPVLSLQPGASISGQQLGHTARMMPKMPTYQAPTAKATQSARIPPVVRPRHLSGAWGLIGEFAPPWGKFPSHCREGYSISRSTQIANHEGFVQITAAAVGHVRVWHRTCSVLDHF